MVYGRSKTVLALVGRDRKTLNIDSSLNWFGYKGTRLKESETFKVYRYSAPMTQLGDKIFGSELYKNLHLSAWVCAHPVMGCEKLCTVFSHLSRNAYN